MVFCIPVKRAGNLFVQVVKLLYRIDTPTNIFPSMHVFIAVACGGAILKNGNCRKYKSVMWGTGTLTVLVVLSTVFLKQHSVVDVVFSIVLYGICYYVFYRVLPGYKEEITRLAPREELLTVPNLLSTFRLVLAVLFWGIYQRYGGMAENRKLLTGILLLSGITDFLDGKIARRFHMVSEVGKILDPIADKVTQGVLLICFFSEYEVAKGVFLLFLVKECYMSVMGTRAIKRVKKNEGAKWYGKINTAVFYAVMAVLVFIPDISEKAANLLILCCGAFMLLAFIMYGNYYSVLLKEEKG